MTHITNMKRWGENIFHDIKINFSFFSPFYGHASNIYTTKNPLVTYTNCIQQLITNHAIINNLMAIVDWTT